ncbi:MAG: hypothetical protein K2J83_06740 [Clostridia bacterium]|nr:hypothetical protein [Clostridia bacterium]
MITENGTVKVRTATDEQMQKELSGNLKTYSLIMLIIGPIGFCAFLTLYLVSVFIPIIDDFTAVMFLILFGIDTCLGIVLKVQFNRALQIVRTSPKVFEYEFFADYFTLNEISNGETVTTAKFYNSQITRVKNGKNYYFLYISQMQVFPVGKAELTENELQVLKSVFRLP